jgi:erythromycin esterase
MKKLLLTFAMFLAAAAAGAQALDEASGTIGFPVRPAIWRLDGIDPDLSAADLEPLRTIIGKAQVVGLGESSHTTGGFYILKHRLFRYLVEEMGFRAFGMETPWVKAEAAARYVQDCQGSAVEAIKGHFPVWQSTELADLVQWMCEWNRSHPTDRVHYFGFDNQQPTDDAPPLMAFLQRVGVAADHSWMEGIRACEGVTVLHPGGRNTPEGHAQCVRALSAIDAHFQRNRADLQRRTSAQDLEMAKLHLVGLRAWEIAAFTIGDDFQTGFSVRDEAMAYTIRTLRAMRFPKAKTAIWAANSHIARSRNLPNGERPMGGFLAAALGARNYVSLGLVAYVGELEWDGVGCGPIRLATPSIEEQLHRLGEDYLLVDMKRDTYLQRRAYVTNIFRFNPHKDHDAVFFLEHAAKMHPTWWAPCR